MKDYRFSTVFFTILAFSLPVSITASQFLFALLVFYGIYNLIVKKKDFSYFPHKTLLLLFILFPLISFLNAENISKSIIWYKRHLYIIVLPIAVVYLLGLKEKKDVFLKAFLAGASISSFVAILQPFFGLNFEKPFNIKTYYVFATGLLSHPLTYSETTSFAIIIALYLFFRENITLKEKSLYISLTALNFLGIIFSREKMPLIAAITVSIAFAFIIAYRKKVFKKALFVGLLFILILSFIPNKQKIMWRFKKEKIEYSVEARTAMWSKSVEFFKKNPFIGKGFGNFLISIKNWDNKGFVTFYHAHSNFFELIATTGLVGVFIFYLFYLIILKDILISLKNRERFDFSLLILAILTLYHIEGLTECTFKDTELNLQLYFFLALFYAVSCPLIKNKNKACKNKQPSHMDH